MQYNFTTQGVCSKNILIETDDGVVKNVEFSGGCNGNTKGIAALVNGMSIDEVINRCTGITCGMKKTSCPDQLAAALKIIKDREAKEQA